MVISASFALSPSESVVGEDLVVLPVIEEPATVIVVPEVVASGYPPAAPFELKSTPEHQLVYALISQYPWDFWEAVHIQDCENAPADPKAVNPRSDATGLWQILQSTHQDLANALFPPYGDLTDPAVNTRVAFELWTQSGWWPWNVGGCYEY